MNGTRPVTRQFGQAQAGDIALIDGDHRHLGRRLDGATDMEQPVKTDVLFEIRTQRGQPQDDTDQAGKQYRKLIP